MAALRRNAQLRDEYGFTGKITIVKDYICGVRQRRREMFVPLTHPPGHAQVDFGEALAVIGGVERKIHFLAMSLPHSDACFVKAYPGETTEAFCDGHVSGFSFFGGVPRSILYDNTRIAVARILGDGKRQRTRVFSELRSHDLFEDRFGRPGKGNDKGKVEGIVGYCRRNFLVPMPRFRNFDDLNTHLEACCAKRWAEQLRGHDQTVGARLERDRAVLQRLPAIAYDACDKRPGRVSSLSLVRYRGTGYSVPTRFGHCEVLVRGSVHEVVISCAAEVIAGHPRSYEQEDFVFDPLHYLSLLEQKTNALDQAAPLAGWLLPPVFGNLRRLLEARMGKAGKREYVQVLRLIESFSLDDVRAAISEALERGVIGFDFARMIEIFDRRRVSFVSVTQAFNTTTSMVLPVPVPSASSWIRGSLTGERVNEIVANHVGHPVSMTTSPLLSSGRDGRVGVLFGAQVCRHRIARHQGLGAPIGVEPSRRTTPG